MKRRLTVLITAIALTASLTACSDGAPVAAGATAPADPKHPVTVKVTVKVGVTDGSQAYWKTFVGDRPPS